MIVNYSQKDNLSACKRRFAISNGIKIGIFSSASSRVSQSNKKLAKAIAEYLTEQGIEIVTGGSLGIPGIVTERACELGNSSYVYSPDHDEHDHHKRIDNHNLKFYKEKKFIPGFTARSLEMIKSIDGAIVLNGRIGTLSEFTIALEEGLPVAVITCTGGIADHLQSILKVSKKKYPKEKIIFTSDYKKAISQLIDKQM